MPGTIAPFPKHQFFTNAGAVAASHKLFTYASGTTTKQATYTDEDISVANANPIVLDSAGRATIFLPVGQAFKFVLASSTDTDPPASPIWTVDEVSAVPAAATGNNADVTGTAGETLALGELCYLSDGSGGATAGRWYKTDADNTYSSTLAYQIGIATAAITSGSSGTIRTVGVMSGLSGLVAGTLYYASATAGALTSTAPTNARPVGVADSTTSLVISPWALGEATASVPGYLSTGTQTIAGAKTASGTWVFGPAFTFRQGTASAAAATVSGRISTDTTTVGNVGAGEDNLMSYSLPANSLSSDGKVVRVTAGGTMAANANNKSIKAYFGATSITFISATAINNSNWRAVVEVIRTGATAQLMQGTLANSSNASVYVPAPATPAETLSGAVTIKFTGEATSDNDVVQKYMIVEVVG